jgi:MYXO-CTERM domain-containing protein
MFNILSHSGTGILRLSPGWTVFEADGTLSLIAPSGNAWNGINPRTGDILPDAPPDPALLTARDITLNLFALSPEGDQVGGQVLIRIDAFPEPGAGSLALAGLVGLAAARRRTHRRLNVSAGAR